MGIFSPNPFWIMPIRSFFRASSTCLFQTILHLSFNCIFLINRSTYVTYIKALKNNNKQTLVNPPPNLTMITLEIPLTSLFFKY